MTFFLSFGLQKHTPRMKDLYALWMIVFLPICNSYAWAPYESICISRRRDVWHQHKGSVNKGCFTRCHRSFFFFLAQIETPIAWKNQNTTTSGESDLIVDLDSCGKKKLTTRHCDLLHSRAYQWQESRCRVMEWWRKTMSIDTSFMAWQGEVLLYVFYEWVIMPTWRVPCKKPLHHFLKAIVSFWKVASCILHICQNGTRIGLVTHEYSNDINMYHRFHSFKVDTCTL